ncbi:MAG: hypothetical protein FWD56_03295 [Bacteroidales bacterium]|nr:hypothetical protein [Bacteroidales bacterium]
MFKKAIIPTILAGLLLFGCNDFDCCIPKVPICKIVETGKQYAQLNNALADITTGQTLLLLQDIDHTDGIVINGIDITLDLDGFTLNVTSGPGAGLALNNGSLTLVAGGGELNISGNDYGVYAANGGAATVTNATATGITGIGVYADTGAEITIEGTIVGDTYIVVSGTPKGLHEGAPSLTKIGYTEYVAGTSYVFLKGGVIDMANPTPAASGLGWTYAGTVYAIIDGATVTVVRSNQLPAISQRRIVVDGATASMTLNGATITGLSLDHSPLLLLNANLTLTIAGTNTLTAGGFSAGIETQSGVVLTINGTGTLTATGGHNGAGIGGGRYEAGGTIDIKGGTIIANGAYGGAGIGGGIGGESGNITIGGNAKVTATGGGYVGAHGGGAGIGSGGTNALTPCAVNSILISSTATVVATGGLGAPGFGKGANIGQGGYGSNDGAEYL